MEVRETTDRALLRGFLGRDRIFAAYAMTDLPVTQKLSLTAGARLEDTDITIEPAGSLFIVVEMDGARTTRPAAPSEVATDLSDSQVLFA